MTNFEKLKECMRIEDFGGYSGRPCKIIHKLRKEESCGDRACKECREWLAKEYVETVVLSGAERTILENVDKEYECIVRDKDGELWVFNEPPTKSTAIWETDYGVCASLELFNHLFKFIKWEDTEPYEIAKLLEG